MDGRGGQSVNGRSGQSVRRPSWRSRFEVSSQAPHGGRVMEDDGVDDADVEDGTDVERMDVADDACDATRIVSMRAVRWL